MARVVLLLVLAVSLVACGHEEARPGPTRAQRQEARLLSDVELIRAAARRTDTSTLHGTPALRRATTRFLDDFGRSTAIARLRKNRLIDHAAGALGGTCEQCFQQLEAVRPIVTR